MRTTSSRLRWIDQTATSVIIPPPGQVPRTAQFRSLSRVALIEIRHPAIGNLAPGTAVPHDHLCCLRARVPILADVLSFLIHGAEIMASLMGYRVFEPFVADQRDAGLSIGYSVHQFAVVEGLV